MSAESSLSNIHTPQRLPGESREAYIARRKASNDWTPYRRIIPPAFWGKSPETQWMKEGKRNHGPRQWRRLTRTSYALKRARQNARA